MGEVKRWSVTYTKHMKQKRKVYQDGFLELQSSSHKVMLYDDCEKLLDNRFLKKDEVVSSGETITFGSYLVDIGDPKGDHKPVPNLDFQTKDKKINKKPGSLHSHSFRSSFISSGSVKAKFGEKKAPSSNLSPSQRIIREYKKSEMSKYSTSPTYPDTTKSKTMEWQVLYTKHLTQKAKKFHDGFLQLALCGSQGRQILLYDATKQLLDSRFLKKDEVIKSGESLAFDGHLVEIEECEGDNKSLKDLNVQGRNCNMVEKTEMMQNRAHIGTESPGEWDVMYTTQITQKTKKYNCGILKVAPCGSYRMQATLISEDGNVLSHKFLKLSEDVRAETTLQFSNYLVEVGEPRTCSKGDQQNSACSWEKEDLDVKSTTVGNCKFGRKAHEDNPGHNVRNCQDNASPRKSILNTRSSTVRCNVPSSEPTNPPIRAACEILSFIKKPMIQEDIITAQRISGEHCRPAQAPDSVHSDFDNLEEEAVRNFNHKRDAITHLDEETMKKHNHSCDTLQPKFTTTAMDFPCSKSGVTGISQPKSSTMCLDIFETRPTSPIMEPQDMVPPKSDSTGQPQIASVLCNRSKTYMEDGSCTDQKHLVADLMCPSFNCNNEEKLTGTVLAATSCLGSSHVSKEPYADKGGIDERCNEAPSVGRLVLNGYNARGSFVTEEKNSQQDTSTQKMDEFPSFDLGF